MAIGGIGALRHRDGQQATTSPTNGTNTLVGVQEMNALVFVRRRELLADTAGAGRFRSGMVIWTMRDLAAELRDVKHGFVSAETASSIYRVAIGVCCWSCWRRYREDQCDALAPRSAGHPPIKSELGQKGAASRSQVVRATHRTMTARMTFAPSSYTGEFNPTSASRR
ncbi:hydantoinase B/oxoprolinase family protein [Bosea sp. BE125]|uniref:hydantoinase B/oxoprolinase family protein n=1 Tax=Bosea sp. BE125 TaxID=2817909 RepID=UPI003857D7B6